MAWGIFWLFDIAWVHQAIERHAMHMAFHPSTDPGIADMRIACLCQGGLISYTGIRNIHIHTYVYIPM